MSDRPSRAVLRNAAPLAVLGLQNLVVFWSHYFRGVGFGWDFPQAYFGMNAFSVAALQHGALPEWQPFQCMGYPFSINLQSGIYYPPLWTVAALGATYDLRIATVLQCLHVLFGAIGAWALLVRATGSRSIALAGAAVFHLFGGFYSNAQHPDIVRSFALLPWIFFAVAPSLRTGEGDAGFTPRLLLLPFFVYLLATGGYPGNLIATSLTVALFLVLLFADDVARGHRAAVALRKGAPAAGLYVLGLAMAAVHLGPPWMERWAMLRTDSTLVYRGLWLEHLPLLVHSSSSLPGEPSMTSTYLTVPWMVLLFFVSWRHLRQRWPWVALLVFSLLMVAGPRSALWRLLASLAGPLRLSRFPSSDYRPLVAVALIVLAALGLRCLRDGGPAAGGFLARGAAALVVVAIAGRALFGVWTATPVLLSGAIAAATVGVLAAVRGRRRGWLAGIAALLVLIGLDAARVLPDLQTWRQPEIDSLYEQRGWGRTVHGMADPALFTRTVGSRPAREETGHKHWYSWAGYLEGRFMMADKAPCILASASEILADPLRKEYMLRPWTPLVLPSRPAGAEGEDGRVALGARTLAAALAEEDGSAARRIQQTSYGIDRIAYRVELPGDALLVENEMYFPGWEAALDTAGGTRRIRALDAAGLRAWPLPAGSYAMLARFEMPHRAVYRALSFGALAVWGVLSAWALLPGTAPSRGRRAPPSASGPA